MAVAIRRLGPGDGSVLARLAEEAPEFDLAGRTSPERPLSPDDAAAYLANPSVLHWVAEENRRVVGELLCHLLPLPSCAGRELLLYSIGVRAKRSEEPRRHRARQEMLRWMGGAGVPEAWVLADNPGAEAFYAACGFAHADENEQGVLMVLNTTVGGDIQSIASSPGADATPSSS